MGRASSGQWLRGIGKLRHYANQHRQALAEGWPRSRAEKRLARNRKRHGVKLARRRYRQAQAKRLLR
jgi:hypothetical protein